jgi:hypothetical protein
LYLFDNTSEDIPMSVAIHQKSEPDPGQGHVEVVSDMNQKWSRRCRAHCVELPVRTLPEAELFSSEKAERAEIRSSQHHGGIQPAALVFGLDHCLIDRDVIQRRIAGRP